MAECESRHTPGTLWARIQEPHPYPLGLTLVLTERCDLACPHCYVPHPEREPHALDLAELTRLLDALAALGVLHLTLTGGEPAVRPDLEAIIAAAMERRFAVALKTNGFALGGSAHVSLVAMEWNAAAILRLEREFIARGIPHGVDPQIDCRTDGGLGPHRFRVGDETMRELHMRSPHLRQGLLMDLGPAQVDAHVCGAGLVSACIMPEGDVVPCIALSSLVFGNVRERSFADLWTTSATRRALIGMRWGDLPSCGACALSDCCTRCPAVALGETGALSGLVEYDCKMAALRKQARAILLAREEGG